jgi:hypothetical protein
VNVSWLAPVKVRTILIGGTNKMITFDERQPSENLRQGVSFTDDPAKVHEWLRLSRRRHVGPEAQPEC